MQSPIVPTTALGAANRDEMSLNLNLNLNCIWGNTKSQKYKVL